MKAVILCAGEGLRLRPFTYSEPKVMINVANKPIVQYVVEALVQNNIRDIVMVVGYKKERIMCHFEDGNAFNASIEYVTQKKQLGTAHALAAAKEHLDSEFIALPGDNIVDSKAINDLLTQSKGPSILITESAEPSQYGVVILSDGKTKQIIEKPEEKIGNLISTGIYKLSPDIFGHLDGLMKEGKYNLTEGLQGLAAEQEIFGVLTSGLWADAIYPWDLLNLNNLAMTQMEGKTAGTIEKGVTLKGTVSVGEETIIRSGSYITGPVKIGSGCEIGPNVCIYPSTSIGNNASVRAFSVIERSTLMDDVILGPNSYISHSVLGMGVRVNSALSVNVGEALIKMEDEVHVVPKVGALIGEDCQLEGGVIASSGTIIGARSKVAALKHVHGVIPNESIVM
jgi:glucose-1-phosphate thymidylyltransferase